MLLIMAEIGYRIGMRVREEGEDSGTPPISATVVGGILGLMAFLLAFTIGVVIDQHNNRKAIVTEEANAVGTAYLRAGFLEEPDLSTSRDLLAEYVEIRLAAAAGTMQIDDVIARSGEIQLELWAIIEENVRQGNDSDIMGLYIESINGVLDVHTLRLRAVELRLPRPLGIMLYAAMSLSFLLVGVVNSADGKRDFIPLLLFALAFVAVVIFIVDLDRPQQGFINVSQDALLELQQMMAQLGS